MTSDSGPLRSAPPRLHFSVAPEPSRLRRARERIRDYLTLHCADETAINDIVLAIEEACTNAIRHSGSEKDIEIRLHFEGERLRAAVTDKGCGFAVESFDATRQPDPLLDHGRGLYLMSKLCDELHLRCKSGLTVDMVKADIPSPRSSEEGAGRAFEREIDYWQRRGLFLRDEMAEAVASVDWEYRFTYANKTALELFDMRLEEGLGRTFWEIFPATREMAVGRAVRRAMELGVSSIEEYVSPTRGHWVECRIYPTGSGVSLYLRDIDERKCKELERDELFERLGASRAMLERSQQLAHLGSWELDLATGRLAWSDEVYRIFGLAPQEFGATYEAFLEHVHPDDRAAVDTAYSDSLSENRNGYEIEHRVVRKDSGEIRLVHERCDHLRDAAGKIVRSVGMVHDITERRRIEESLGEARRAGEQDQARVRATLDSLLDPHVLLQAARDEGGRIVDFVFTDANRAACEFNGLAYEELIGTRLLGLHPAAGTTELFDRYVTVVESGKPLILDDWSYPQDLLGGEVRRYDVRAARIGDGLSQTWRDVTERRRLADEHRRRDDTLRQLLAHMSDGVLILDRQWRYTFVNDRTLELTGKPAEELLGRVIWEVFPAINGTEFERALRAATAVRAPRTVQVPSIVQNGWNEVRIYPTADGLALFYHDVTERKRAEQEHERLLKQLSHGVEREMRTARIAETLSKINEILLSAVTPDDVIARLVGEVSQAAGADKALVIRMGDDGSYTITHVRNVRNDLVGEAKDAAFYPGFALAAAERHPILIADNWTDERLNCEFVVPYGLHAFQLLPLIVEGEVTHVLALSYDKAQAFDDEDYRAAERMAAAMSLALRNALLFEAEREARLRAAQQLEFAQVLLDVSAAIAEWTELEPMLEGLANALLRSTAHAQVTIGLWDEERKSMAIVVSKGSHPIPLATLGLNEMSAPARRMVKTKRRVLIDYAKGKDEGLRKLAKQGQLRYGLAVPVVSRGRLVASITVDAPGERRTFSDREVDLIQAVADQAAVAVENARLAEGLRKSEEGARFLANVVETADVPFAVRQPDGRLVLFNQAFVELVGYSRRELEEGASTLAVGLTPPDWWEVEEPLLAEAIAERRPVRYEKEYVCKDGSRLPVEVFAQPVYDKTGEFLQYHSFITDISERRRAEEALQASEAKYRTLFDNMAEEVHFWRLVRDEAGEIRTWRLVSANPPALTTWGFGSLKEIEGKTTDEIFGPGATEHYMPTVQQIMSEGVAASYEDYFPNLDKHFRFTSVPLGEYFITTGADITAVKKSEQAALEAERRFRATFEQAAVGIGHCSPDGRWLRVNDKLCQMMGYSRTQLLRLTLADVTDPDDLPADLAHIDDLLTGKAASYTMEKRYLRKDGRLLWGALTASLVRDEAGGPTYFVAVIEDISARKQAEEEREILLKQSQAQTEELQVQGEKLQVQREELQAQTEELRVRSDELAERVRLTEALNAVNRLVHSTLEFDEIMQRALNQGIEALAVDAGTIEMRDGSQWVVRYQCGFAETDIGRRLSETEAPNATRAFVSMEPFAIADMQANPAVNVGFVRDHALRSVLAVPLMARGAVIGCLFFYGRQARAFNEAETDFAGKLGATVSLALENARQRDELGHTAALRYARSLIEASLDPLVTISAEGKITDVNAATEQATGITRDSLIGSDFCDYFTEPDQARAGYLQVFSEGSVVDYPLAIRHRDGSTRDVLYNASLYRDEAGAVAGVFAAARDVTQQKRLEQVALENARRFEEQKRIAVALQENFIHPLPAVDGLELGVVSQTAHEPELVGGDLSDVFVIDGTRVVVLVADVAGKGVHAAGMTETVRSTVRALAAIDPSPAFVLQKANELLLRFDPDEPHVTAFCAVLDPHTGHLSYASAGHPAPIHLGAFTCRTLDVVFGPPLGTFQRPYTNAHAMLTLEDYLVFYTDGVTEARRDGDLLGEERLVDIVAGLRGGSAQKVAEGVRDAAMAYADQLHDDLQVVVLRLA